MKKEDIVYVLLEDDTEILGNGLGHVMYRQYLPVLKYVDILKRNDMKSTFYIDIAHLLFLKENLNYKDFSLQANMVEETIFYLLENNMEVQLHIHSQWVNAKIENEEILVTNKWNIGQLDEKDQVDLFNKSLDCLTSIINKSKKRNDLISFKAGSWGLQPFDILFKEFSKRGIKLVLGPIKGLKVPALNLDYSKMESGIYPYYCDEYDINMIGGSKEIIVAPMTPTYLNWVDFFRYLIFMKLKKIKNKFDFDLDILKISEKITKLKPLSGKDKLSISLKPFKTHLKINSQPFWYLKNTFKRSYKMIMNSDNNFKLLIIETHTKDFKNNFIEIDSFFNHLKEDYSNLKFITSTELLQHLENKKNTIKTKN